MPGLIILIGLMFLGPAAKADESPSRHLKLRLGDSEEMRYPPGTDLAISRRGLVDVFHLGDGRWQVTGLHPGFVVIDAHDAVTGEPRWPRLFIDVLAPGDLAQPLTTAFELPKWLCSQTKIKCDKEAGIVTGLAPSFIWYTHARSTCLSLSGCYFAVTLPQSLLDAWLSSLRRTLGDPYAVKLGQPTAEMPAVPIVEVYCGRAGREKRREEVDALTNRSLTEGLLWLRCLEEHSLARYRLQVRMFLVEASTAASLGIEPEMSGTVTFPLANSSAGLLGRLDALAKEHRAEMIGEPILRLTANQQGEMLSGGEFQVIEHVVRTDTASPIPERSDWKQQGLQLKATIAPLTGDTVHLSYDMSFKARLEAGDALAVNQLKSDVDLPLGSPMMVGVLDLKATDTDHLGLPYIDEIPIIGPLFRRTLSQSANSRLLLWLTVREDQSAGPLGEGK